MILLFDLDGTVLTFDDGPKGPGRAALDLAMRELHGRDDATSGVRLAGGTDRALARALLRVAGAGDDPAAIDLLLATYLRHLEAVLTTRRYRPIGDVAGTVAACRARGACVAVATGNVREGARIKLASARLDPVFDLERGGYGCDAEPREDVLRAAVARCAAHGDPARVVVIGDTEHDVRAARAIGARVVGVAVRPEAREELAAAGADAIVDRCGEPLVAAIFAVA